MFNNLFANDFNKALLVLTFLSMHYNKYNENPYFSKSFSYTLDYTHLNLHIFVFFKKILNLKADIKLLRKIECKISIKNYKIQLKM